MIHVSECLNLRVFKISKSHTPMFFEIPLKIFQDLIRFNFKIFIVLTN